MSMRVPDEFIALLRDKVDITDVISEYVKLKRVGQSFVGLCPFHGEKSPSFHVTPAKGFYYCFGCGAGGTVFNFLMEMEHISFVMAVEELAKRAGIPMPVMDQDALTDHAQSQKAKQSNRIIYTKMHSLLHIAATNRFFVPQFPH